MKLQQDIFLGDNMTVKELKEELNKFNDNLIVMIPNKRTNKDLWFPYIAAGDIYQGTNEADGCVFIGDYISCETCAYCDTDIDDQPCCSCVEGENWEKG